MPSSIKSTVGLPGCPHVLPRLGFGVYKSPTHVCVNSCLAAIKVGYRHIDTAQCYENEASVGRAVRESKLSRCDFFITSKILYAGRDVETTYKSIVESVEKVDGKGGYIDLFLVQSPNGGPESRKLMWLALEKAKAEGRVRDIGVSNYGAGHIEEIREFGTSWPPVVNQIELHPWCQQREIVEYCQRHNIVIEACCPLVRNQRAHDKTLLGIAEKHNKTPEQVLIRYSLQKNWVPLPKSDNPARIASIAQVFDFELSDDNMDALDGLDQGTRGAIVQAVNIQGPNLPESVP